MKSWLRSVLLVGLLATTGAAHGAAVLLNGDFELGNFNNGPEDWVHSLIDNDSYANQWNVGTTSRARSGVLNAVTACQNMEFCLDPVSGARLWQDLDTHPGDRYLLGFWLATSNNTENGLNVYWGDHLVLALRNEALPTQYLEVVYKYFEVEVKATSFGTRLMFTGFNNQAHVFLDDVSLTVLKSVPVPEPSTLTLLGLGLAGLAFTRRRTLVSGSIEE